MKRFDFSKYFFIFILSIVILGFFFFLGMHSGSQKTAIYRQYLAAQEKITKSFKTFSQEASTVSKIRPEHFLQASRYKGDGVTVNQKKNNQDDLILLSGFFDKGNELRLIRRDGTIINRWPIVFSKIFSRTGHIYRPPKTNWNIDIHGALALPDGSVVFNFEYGGLVKLDRCGKVVWKVKRMSHHSVELAQDGGFWVPGRRWYKKNKKSPFPPFQPPFFEDTLLKISERGKILDEISVPGLFYKSGLVALLTATGGGLRKGMEWNKEIVHLNKIAELSSDIADDFSLFNTGDLVLSIRNSNLIFVIDPKTQKIKWWQIGPWIRQHDPEFSAGGIISIFNNNAYTTLLRNQRGGKNKCPLSAPRISNIIEIDPSTGRHQVVYGNRRDQNMLTIIRGKHQPTSDGGYLITEFEGGRVFEIDNIGRVIWEYINRYDEDEVAEISEARVYPANYFKKMDWSDCPK
ncbi:MAG: hypothetical protein GY699_03365 [Desulfobacteraceae bacterium]|nr:hypothetical protein [Desulfobacteraceae bacterium]